MRRYARHLDRNDHEDLVQDAVARAVEKWDVFRPELGSREQWLVRIVHNTYINRVRASTHRLPSGAPSDMVDEIVAPDDSELLLYVRDLERILSNMNKGMREVFLIASTTDLTYEDIQKCLSVRVPLGTVRSRLSRARGLIRAGLR